MTAQVSKVLQIQPQDRPREGTSDRCRACPTRTVCLASEVDAQHVMRLPQYFRCEGPLAAGEHLYHAGDPALTQYHLRSGMVKTYIINSAGDEYVTGFYLPGEIIGNVHVQGGYCESAVALETTTVCQLDEEALQGCAQMGLVPALFRHLAANASIEARHQINLKQTTAQARVAGFLVAFKARLERLGRNPNFLPTPMSRTDIASYLGMTLESLSRVISKLHTAKVIRATRNSIEILDPATLDTIGLHVLH